MEELKTYAQFIWIIVISVINIYGIAFLMTDIDLCGFRKKQIIPIVVLVLEFIILTYFAWG